MIKRHIVLSLNDPNNPEELVLRVQSTTDGKGSVILECFAPKVNVSVDELQAAVAEAKQFALECGEYTTTVVTETFLDQVKADAIDFQKDIVYGEDEASNS